MNFFKIGENVISPSKYSNKNEKGEILEIQKGIYAYVRFNNFDKRLDEWVPLTQLSHDTDTSKNPIINFPKKTEMKKNLNNAANTSDSNQNKPIRNIDSIRIGDYEIDSWYFSPYPSEFCKSRHLFICEYCFKYFSSPNMFRCHFHAEKDCRPKGFEIYRKGSISIFEISSTTDRICCQSLFLLCKLFLDESVLSYMIDNVSFLILCECDKNGAHPVGFLSRPTNWDGNIILYEIVILPPYQRKGYSQILLSCVYEMAHRSFVIGGIGRSLTDLGKPALEKFFANKIVGLLRNKLEEIKTIKDITLYTSICKNDVSETFKNLKIMSSDDDDDDDDNDNDSEDDETLPIEEINIYLKKNPKIEKEIPFDKDFLMWFTEDLEEEEVIQDNPKEYDSDSDQNDDPSPQ